MTHNPQTLLDDHGTGAELLRSYQQEPSSAIAALMKLFNSQTAVVSGNQRLVIHEVRMPHTATYQVPEWDESDGSVSLQQNEPARTALEEILRLTGLSIEQAARLLAVSRQSVHLWRRGRAINQRHLERLLAVHDVLSRAAAHNPTSKSLRGWLHRPRGAEGYTPWQLLVHGEFDKARLLAMTKPSPGLLQPPAWLRKPTPPAMRAGRESRIEAYPPADREPLVDDDDAPADESWVE